MLDRFGPTPVSFLHLPATRRVVGRGPQPSALKSFVKSVDRESMPFRAGVSFMASATRLGLGSLLAAIGALTIGACVKYEKSQNPLSPTLAGPLPGVTITQPSPVQPNQNSRIPVDQQPIVLTVNNATTNSVRP